MSFQISALPAAAFAHLFTATDEQLAGLNAIRVTADRTPGFPCRVSLMDAEPGETLVLVNYTHQDAASPYQARHAIYIRAGAQQAYPAVGEIPLVLRRRLLSVRGFDAKGMMRAADVTDGERLDSVIAAMFADPDVAYLHVHNAKPGCYAARVDRA